MMKKSAVFAVLIVALVFAGCGKAKKAGPPEEFSADLTAKGGPASFSGKIYVKKDKVRIDMQDSA